mmetsp:Transcript_19660/g.40531  ORF Transcript_19660/g.40531 Transcript_19660/m.40531 type:complete len:92 (-) Transcript_19660:472-747(-)
MEVRAGYQNATPGSGRTRRWLLRDGEQRTDRACPVSRKPRAGCGGAAVFSEDASEDGGLLRSTPESSYFRLDDSFSNVRGVIENKNCLPRQ